MINVIAFNELNILGFFTAFHILSFVLSVCYSVISSQAGAKHVYAVEASEMAEYAKKLIAGNPILGYRITVRIVS